MSSIQDSFDIALGRIEQYLEQSRQERTSLSADLLSHRTGVQYALFAIVSAIKLSPGFDVTVLREFARAALDSPPPGFEDDPTFREPLTLLMSLLDPTDVQ